MSYSIEERKFENSKWIFGKDEFLQNGERIENIEGAKWIWSIMYSRVYLRKYFTLDEIKPCYAKFICDNVFDFFVNGKPVSLNKKKFAGDITHDLEKGENVNG